MADPPSNNMNVMVQLLTATIEKQGQMLQAIQDTNRNVERLATRIESIETVIARMTPSSGGRTPTPATQQTVQVAFDRDDVPIAGPSLSVESSAPVVVHKGAAAAAKANLTVPEAPTVVPDAQARTKFANDANTPNAGARLGHMKAPAASFSSKVRIHLATIAYKGLPCRTERQATGAEPCRRSAHVVELCTCSKP